MLRILKDGKVISLKDQEKLVAAKGSIENCGRPLDLNTPEAKAPAKHPGLKTAKAEKDAKTKG